MALNHQKHTKEEKVDTDYEKKRGVRYTSKTPPKKDTPVPTSSNVLIREVSSKPLEKRRLRMSW